MSKFYLAWVDETDTVFSQPFAREDEVVFTFDLRRTEANFALLSIEVVNPRVGLLGVGRKQWAWLSYEAPDTSGIALPLFFGRLIGIPTSIFSTVCTLEFIARPVDFVAQKEALANTLRVLPWYDPALFEPSRRADPDLVLETYAKFWHIDPITHVVSVSDVLFGEDGTEVFGEEGVLYESLGLRLNNVPLTAVTVEAEFQWTQRASGTLDLTQWFYDSWPNDTGTTGITSFTLDAGSWPKSGAAMGDGWTVHSSSVSPTFSEQPRHTHAAVSRTLKWPDGETTTVNATEDHDVLDEVGSGSIKLSGVLTQYEYKATYSERDPEDDEPPQLMSVTSNSAYTDGWVLCHHITQTTVVRYDANRGQVERIKFTLRADVQPIVTLPGDDESLRIDNLKTVDLSEPIEPAGSADQAPIGDPRRRTYVCQPRGLQSLEYLILLARAKLLMRSRAVEITFNTTFERAAELTLRKNAQIFDPRLPGGVALGKVTAVQISLSGDAGEIVCAVTIGCAIGYGGEVDAVGGTPEYVEDDYITAAEDYQQYIGRIIAFDTSVGYSPPLFAPNDDGLDFIGGVSVAAAIEIPLEVEWPPEEQISGLSFVAPGQIFTPNVGNPNVLGNKTLAELAAEILALRAKVIGDFLKDRETVATFRLRAVTGVTFETVYEIDMTDLQIPTMIDLEAANT